MTITDCYFHGDEPVSEGAYRVCFECGHCYPTADHLLNAYNTEAARYDLPHTPAVRPSDIDFCPLCTHDW